MSRAYKGVRPKSAWVYSGDQVQELYQICKNTLSNWMKLGLCPSDRRRPYVFRGAELIRFHEERAQNTHRALRLGAFKCFTCKSISEPDPSDISIEATDAGHRIAQARCRCGGRLKKFLNATACDRLGSGLTHNTNPGPADEYKGRRPVGIGISQVSETAPIHKGNDRIIFEWQIFATGLSPKTADAYLAAIRQFESYCGGVGFETLTSDLVNQYRLDLIAARERPKDRGGLSAMTIAHRAAFVRKFLTWLIDQEGFKHLNRVLPHYTDLPKRAVARSDPKAGKAYPTMEEAAQMVAEMPDKTIVELRNQAIVAMAFTTGLRADALTTLRLKHLDTVQQFVVQDGREMRAKNSKSFVVNWFPRTEAFHPFVIAWAQRLRGFGFEGPDALFPAGDRIRHQLRSVSAGRDPIVPMRSISAVTDAFATASQTRAGQGDYTPHSARHSLAALGQAICLTPQARKAWSLNLGHESEATTWTAYGHMSARTKAPHLLVRC